MIVFGEEFSPDSIFLQLPISSPGFQTAVALSGVANPSQDALYISYSNGVIQGKQHCRVTLKIDLYFFNNTYGVSTAASLPFGPIWSPSTGYGSRLSYRRDVGSVIFPVTNSEGQPQGKCVTNNYLYYSGSSIYLLDLEEFESLCYTVPAFTVQYSFTFSSDVSTFYYFANNTQDDTLTLYGVPLKNVPGGRWLTPPVCPAEPILELNGSILITVETDFDMLHGVVMDIDLSFYLFNYNLTSGHYKSTILDSFTPIMPYSFDPALNYFIFAITTGPVQNLVSISTSTLETSSTETSISAYSSIYVDTHYVYVCTNSAVNKYTIFPLDVTDSSAIPNAVVYEEKIYSYYSSNGQAAITVYDTTFKSLGVYSLVNTLGDPSIITIATYFDYTIFYFGLSTTTSTLIIGDQHYNVQNYQTLSGWSELPNSYYFFAGVAYAISPVSIATVTPAYFQLKRLR
jgi:hypothetical protein